MNLKVGALFAGYGGIELALGSVLDVHPAWFSEFDKAPSAILKHHWPDVPNLGDVTKIDWAAVEPVDIITGGSPCQDLSHAGKRKGMTDGTRSNLWVEMREAIAIIRPRLVVWENVRGALSAEAASDLEQCPRCVGDPRDRGPVLRALGRVVGDLADLGYVGRVYGLRASDVGGAHGRFRVFLFATPANAGGFGGFETVKRDGRGATRGDGAGVPDESDRDALRVGPVGVPGHLTLLPTPRAEERGQRNSQDQGHALSATQDWREYEAAIRRQEAAFGRPAPFPTEPGAKGQPRLSPKFVEWLMGLPDGWVTDPAIGISRNDQLKALGNGVVPAQCAAALRAFLTDTAKERAA